MDKLTAFGRITKVDLRTGIVEGIGADETLDRDGEIFDYNSSKPYIENWSNAFAETTKAAGQEVSYGNIRSMHANIAAGKVTAINFDDGGKAVNLSTYIADKGELEKCATGIYTGFSIKGRAIKKWKDAGRTRYTVDPIEFSLVDLPCNPNATFTVVKADGSQENREFQDIEKREFSERRRHDLADSGKALPDGSFPIESIADLHNAIQAVGRAKDYEAAKKHIMERAHALDASDQLPAGWSAEKLTSAADVDKWLASWAFRHADELKLTSKGVAILNRLTTDTAKEAATMTEAEKQAAAAAEIAKKADHLAKATAAHEEIGKCLTGACDHKGVGKCMEKMASEHEKMGKSLEKLGKEKDDAEETDEEKAAKVAKAAADAAAKKEKDELIEKAAKLGLTLAPAPAAATPAADPKVAELEKAVSELKALVEKNATVERKTPLLRGRSVSKADDANADDKDVKKFGEIKKDDPELVKKGLQTIFSAEPVLID